jgi:peptidoglycan/LPS O-acetylase OafA/YrhL
MGVKLRHVEKVVHAFVAKPLAWAIYGSGVVLVILALASFRAIRRWTQRKRRENRCQRRS